MLEEYLADLESRIDPETEEQLAAAWKEFVDGRFAGGIFSPRRSGQSSARITWPKIAINDGLDDCELMIVRELAMCSETLADGSGGLLGIRANYGTGILPSLFGAELFIMERALETLPTTRPLSGGPDTFRKLLDRGIPDPHSGLGARVLEFTARFAELQRLYPKVSRYVRQYHPDLQGPMDLCELLWGSSLFLDMYDHAALVKDVLALITETYLRFFETWKKMVPQDREYSVHWGALQRGPVMLRDDSAMNFSPDFYREFIRPYDTVVLQRAGGGAIHFCGRGDHFIEAMSETPGLHAIAMSQPHLNKMETIYRHTVDKGIKLLGLARPAAEYALAEGRLLHGHVHCA